MRTGWRRSSLSCHGRADSARRYTSRNPYFGDLHAHTAWPLPPCRVRMQTPDLAVPSAGAEPVLRTRARVREEVAAGYSAGGDATTRTSSSSSPRLAIRCISPWRAP